MTTGWPPTIRATPSTRRCPRGSSSCGGCRARSPRCGTAGRETDPARLTPRCRPGGHPWPPRPGGAFVMVAPITSLLCRGGRHDDNHTWAARPGFHDRRCSHVLAAHGPPRSWRVAVHAATVASHWWLRTSIAGEEPGGRAGAQADAVVGRPVRVRSGGGTHAAVGQRAVRLAAGTV